MTSLGVTHVALQMEVEHNMKRLVILGAGAVGAAAMALFGAGTATASPDVVGMTYADASNEIASSGGHPVVAVTVGSKLDRDDCLVTNAWDATFVRDSWGAFGHAKGEVMLALNCNGGKATAANPGNSVLSSAGREARVAPDQAEAAESEIREEVSTPNV